MWLLLLGCPCDSCVASVSRCLKPLLLAALAEGVLLALVVALELLGVRVGDGLDLLELERCERVGTRHRALHEDDLVRAG